MRKVILLFFWGALGISGNSQGPNALTWDATNKEYHAQAGETQTTFTFRLTNSAPSEISILNVSSSCGCAVVNLPTRPWKIEPGKDGELQVKVDFRGKRGTLSKTAIVQASTGPTVLMFTVTIPEAAAMNAAQRERNIALAQADRQAVFKSNCASCLSRAVQRQSHLAQAAIGQLQGCLNRRV